MVQWIEVMNLPKKWAGREVGGGRNPKAREGPARRIGIPLPRIFRSMGIICV